MCPFLPTRGSLAPRQAAGVRCIVLGGWAKVGAGGLPSAALRAYAAQHVLFHPVRRAAPPTSALAWMAAAERHRRRELGGDTAPENGGGSGNAPLLQ